MAERVAFIGLGVMGSQMAAWLVKAGHDVTVFNRTLAKARAFAEATGARAAETPIAAAKDARFVFSCVGNDEHLSAVTLGREGAFEGMAEGGIFVDHSTSSAALARDLSRYAQRKNLGYLDAPVTGGQIGAEQGTLSVMVGGNASDFEKARPVISAYGKHVRLLGPAGSGQLAKMVNQICIAGLLQGLAEALNFAETAGLDPADVVDVISRGAAQSWQMDQRHRAMIDGTFEFGFAVDWMRKDLNLAIEEARRNGAPLPVTALVDQFYADVQGMGGQRWDTSSLIARLRARTGKI